MGLPAFDIFLSYKSHDSPWVERLHRKLRQRGARVWLDQNEIRPGDHFAEALENGLESSRSVGLVITKKSMASGWVKEEFYRALSLSKARHLHLIPILVEEARLPGFLGTRHYVDFRSNKNFDRRVDELIWPGIWHCSEVGC